MSSRGLCLALVATIALWRPCSAEPTAAAAREAILSHLTKSVDDLDPLAELARGTAPEKEHKALKESAAALSRDPSKVTPEEIRTTFQRLRATRGELMGRTNFDPESDNAADDRALRAFLGQSTRPAATTSAREAVGRLSQIASPTPERGRIDLGRPVFDGDDRRGDAAAVWTSHPGTTGSRQGSPPGTLMYVTSEATDLRRQPIARVKDGTNAHDDLLESQLVKGEPVRVLRTHDGWAYVQAIGQLSSKKAENAPTGPSNVLGGYPGWVDLRALSADEKFAAQRAPVEASRLRDALVESAAGLVGTKYLWGGRSSEGVDCSGLVHWAATWAGYGPSVARDTKDQYLQSAPIAADRMGKGDLVFFEGSRGIHHVAMYSGSGGTFIEAPHTGGRVRRVSLEDLTRRFPGERHHFRTLIGPALPAAAAGR